MRVAATVNYHIHSKKRQAFHFDVDGVYGNLISPELVSTSVDVQDFRGTERPISFSAEGITFEQHNSQITDFSDMSAWEAVYNAELKTLLAEKIGAKAVVVFDHTVRIDEPDSPRKPARNVHNDYSPSGAEERLIDILGEERAAEFRSSHYAFVNIWRPVEQTIQSSPLGFIHPNSLAPEDRMGIDLIYPEEVREILGVAANERHQWFYWSGMTPDEVIIFNTYDNQGRPSLSHSALDMENDNTQFVRKSIESRTIVRWDLEENI